MSTERLQQEFPNLCLARTSTICLSAQATAPLLWENLNLSQLYERLSDQGITELAGLSG